MFLLMQGCRYSWPRFFYFPRGKELLKLHPGAQNVCLEPSKTSKSTPAFWEVWNPLLLILLARLFEETPVESLENQARKLASKLCDTAVPKTRSGSPWTFSYSTSQWMVKFHRHACNTSCISKVRRSSWPNVLRPCARYKTSIKDWLVVWGCHKTISSNW